MLSSGRIVLILIILVASGLRLEAQYLDNPSLEGAPMMHQPPPGWIPCDDKSTPDTQPGTWGHTKPASDGNTYMSMVTRGPWGGNAFSTEDCEAELLKPFSINECYTLSLDLSTCDECGHTSDIGWISYANPVMLEIYASRNPCGQEELITRIGPIENIDWKTYQVTFSPEIDGHRYLLLKANWISLPEYFGTVLVDNLRLEETTPRTILLDQTLEAGDTLRLDAGKGDHYLWSPAYLLSCSDCPSPTATFSGNMVYTVTIRDSSKTCPWQEVFRLWTESSVFIPNAFTPNNDGLNDHFGPVFSGNLIRMNFRVFDRYGQQVFHSSIPSDLWDGRINGKIASPGSYAWKLDYEVFIRRGQQKFVRTGMVMVLR